MVDATHDYLLIAEVAEIARTSVDTVRAWIRSGRLRSVRPGRRRLVRRVDLDAFLTRDVLAERKGKGGPDAATG